MDTSSGGRRGHRSWPEALKREIVEASFASGSSVSVVARRYDVNANQVFGWRKLFRDSAPASVESGPALVPVTVTSAPGDVALPPVPRAADTMEIELAGGYRIRVSSGVDGKALRRVLDVLERR